jgi:hypothetical protein
MNRTTTIRRIAHVLVVAAALSTSTLPSFARDVSTGQTGGGSCSLWSMIKSSMYGVDCRFY